MADDQCTALSELFCQMSGVRHGEAEGKARSTKATMSCLLFPVWLLIPFVSKMASGRCNGRACSLNSIQTVLTSSC